jgi:hypothetical protein
MSSKAVLCTPPIHDPNSRPPWQLLPSQFEIIHPRWNKVLASMLKHGLLAYPQFKHRGQHLRLKRMMIHDAGSSLSMFGEPSFKPQHKGNILSNSKRRKSATEEEGALLLVIFPSTFAGGEMVISRGKHHDMFDFSEASAHPAAMGNMWFAIFSEACHFEVKEVVTGHLVYLMYQVE